MVTTSFNVRWNGRQLQQASTAALTMAALLLTHGCSANEGQYGEDNACGCPQGKTPVCGSDGETHASECHAHCAGVTPIVPGFCSKGCHCPAITDPVCGTDGVTYANGCLQNCVLPVVNFAYYGPCRPDCDCNDFVGPTVCTPDEGEYENVCYAECAGLDTATLGECFDCAAECEDNPTYDLETPVCLENGESFENACLAHCAFEEVNVAYTGRCVDACECGNMEGPPVCGTDGVTYASACLAGCVPTAVAFEGACMRSCNCTAEKYEPVCSRGRVTYLNDCFSRCTPDVVVERKQCSEFDYYYATEEAYGYNGGGSDYADDGTGEEVVMDEMIEASSG